MADERCTCPGDYHDYLVDDQGTITVVHHNDWCPAHPYYVGRVHWHDFNCYEGGDIRYGTRICGKQAGRDPR
jgi:hypothetical protein